MRSSRKWRLSWGSKSGSLQVNNWIDTLALRSRSVMRTRNALRKGNSPKYVENWRIFVHIQANMYTKSTDLDTSGVMSSRQGQNCVTLHGIDSCLLPQPAILGLWFCSRLRLLCCTYQRRRWTIFWCATRCPCQRTGEPHAALCDHVPSYHQLSSWVTAVLIRLRKFRKGTLLMRKWRFSVSASAEMNWLWKDWLHNQWAGKEILE